MSIAAQTELPILATARPLVTRPPRVALVGNPNAGKTSLFNRLTGLRAKTANFPGTTVEHRRGRIVCGGKTVELIDLPGLYSLDAVTPDEQVARQIILGERHGASTPDLLVIVVDATNIERNLFLASQVLELEQSTIVALTQIDLARKQGIGIDLGELSQRLGCRVVPVSARTGEGIAALHKALAQGLSVPEQPVLAEPVSACGSCGGCQYATRYDWAERTSNAAVHGGGTHGHWTEAIDRVVTHKFVGLMCFAAVMFLTFMLIFWIAQYPMELIDGWFALAGGAVNRWLPAGDLASLLADGLIGGVGGMLIFLPQICLLFFVLALLEDSGYMARAAFVMDKLMHRVGLPGKAFVPMLSAHACAIPAIMSTRVIEDRRDRLATILVLPLMSCSARVPVYAMVTALLFPHDPLRAALLFAGAYLLGIVAALAMALVFKTTLLKGRTKPLVIELPHYRLPSLRNAFVLMLDRAWVFIKTAGSVILVISLAMWILATYPKTDIMELPAEQQTRIAQLQSAGDTAAADALLQQAQLEHSFAGRMGAIAQPVFAPLGFDWKMSIGIVSSFAAREVIVSTLAVLYGVGEAADEDVNSLYQSLRSSKHPDGAPVYTTAACLSLLVFYVLAMQCLPTQAVTRRETGSWKWPAIQLAYMSVLAYTAALVTYQTASWCGL
ncbi:MAG: ferrous iron transport protein B [Pirellulales bacterium]